MPDKIRVLDVKVVFNGKEYPMRDPADLDKMKGILSLLEKFFEYDGDGGESSWGMPLQPPLLPEPKHQEAVSIPVSQTPLLHSPPPEGQREMPPAINASSTPYARSWFKRGWLTLNHPSTVDEILEASLKLGFKANKPLKLLKRAVRENPYFVATGHNSEGATLFGLATPHDADTEPTTSETEKAQSFTEAKETAQYAKEVLGQARRKMTSEEIAERMLTKGWQTKSDTAEKRAKNAHAAMWRNQDIFLLYETGPMSKGLWGLKAWEGESTPLLFDKDTKDGEGDDDDPF